MNRTIAKWVFFTLEFLRREPVYRTLKEHEYIQQQHKSKIKEIQQKKLEKLTCYAMKHNEYFQRKYDGYDIINDFSNLPVMTKDELKNNYADIVTGNDRKLDLAKTSGSTGNALKFYRDRILFAHTLSSKFGGHRWYGLDMGSKEARLWGVPVDLKGRIKIKFRDLILNRFRERSFDITEDVFFDFYKKILKKTPEYIYGYTSMIYEFALFLKEKQINGNMPQLKVVICTSESIPDYQRVLMEDVFGCNVAGEYGAAETGIISFECKQGNHHIMEDSVLVEVVDEDYKPVKNGEEGKILVTVLNSYSSPIIRYDLGDIVVCSDEKCTCGINFSLFKKIIGRESSIVVTPSGKVFHSLIFYYIMKNITERGGIITQFKVYQKEIDQILIQLVSNKKEFDMEELTPMKIKLREIFGDQMNFKFEFVEKIEREKSGKLRDFVSEIDTDVALQEHYS